MGGVQLMSALATLLPALLGLIGGLGGVALGAWLVQRRERQQRELAFVERQLKEFYSPMLGLRTEIETRTHLRGRIQTTAGAVWRDLTDGRPGQPIRQMDATKEATFQRLIEDDSTTFKEQLLPAYQQMAALFRESLWLADADTRSYYPELMEYLDVWERYLRQAIPGEVVSALGHTEDTLQRAGGGRPRMPIKPSVQVAVSYPCLRISVALTDTLTFYAPGETPPPRS
jgi:hypothetical protein